MVELLVANSTAVNKQYPTPLLKKVVSLKGETTFVLGGGAAFACWALGQAGVSAA
jgi:hypothetical protein